LVSKGQTQCQGAVVCADAPLLSHEQRTIDITKVPSSTPPPLSLSSLKQGKIDNVKAPLSLPSCVLLLLMLLRKPRAIGSTEVPLMLPSHAPLLLL
jgi:hypothetical protein